MTASEIRKEWRPDGKEECDGCEQTKTVMDCAELGYLCYDCFVDAMYDLFDTD